ncbi:phosphoglycolate phosphatase [Natronomonas sp. EA1]|uniref:phosphoglycolate phosphatase n=1 Tax=Natronomonas sp. EA1 TaxID=3421655 RepID=UPI003EBD5983
MTPPLAVDIDGTLTRQDKSIDPRVFDVLRAWADEAPVIIATGKAFPYPVGLCEFLGIPLRAIAENGGVVYVEEAGEVVYNGDPDAAWAVAEAFEQEGYDLGWGPADMVNRWRETEVAVSLDRPGDRLRELAAREGQEVVDTGYAYHVKSPSVNKGTGLVSAADGLGLDPEEFVAVGDSENDAEVFTVAGESFAVANADEHARAAADHVLDASFADGFLAVAESFGIATQ